MLFLYLLPEDLWDLVALYVDFITYSTLISLDPILFNQEKLRAKNLKQIPREDLTLFAQSYDYATEFMKLHFPGRRINMVWLAGILSETQTVEDQIIQLIRDKIKIPRLLQINCDQSINLIAGNNNYKVSLKVYLSDQVYTKFSKLSYAEASYIFDQAFFQMQEYLQSKHDDLSFHNLEILYSFMNKEMDKMEYPVKKIKIA